MSSSPAPRPRLAIQKTHAAFVSKLYAMVADASTDGLISWTAEGDCFKVTDPSDLSREVLPAYFKHGNWQSFVRQLNMYGFHKISDLAYGAVFGEAQLWVFKHPCFRRGELKLLQNIKRRGAKPGTSPTLAPTPAESVALAQPHPGASKIHSSTATATLEPSPANYSGDLQHCIAALQRSNAELQRENQEMRTAIEGCQSAVAGIMRFLESAVVQPAVGSADTPQAARMADAFRQLASEIVPVLPHAADQSASAARDRAPRNRSSSRSSTSSGSSSEAGNCLPQPLTHVVLPPIANMVGSIACGHPSAGASWMCAQPHSSSLRGTLPAKRLRLDGSKLPIT